MVEDWFPVQHSLLSAAMLGERVLPQYELPGAAVCHFWSQSINDLYLVETPASRYFLRISPAGWRSEEQVLAEINLLQFLRERHLTAPQPIPRRDGAYVQALHAPEGLRYAILFGNLRGTPCPPDETGSFRFGMALAKLHTATDEYGGTRAGLRFEPEDLIDTPLDRLKPWFAKRSQDYTALLETGARLKEVTGHLSHSAPQWGICHGDAHLNNFLVEDSERWALLDFEYFGYGWRVYDLAACFNYLLHEMEWSQARRSFDAFLEGYQSLRGVSQMEINAIPALVILRQFWLMGTAVRMLPRIGLQAFQTWIFEVSLPFIKRWQDES